jgi:putative copper resistance protein D
MQTFGALMFMLLLVDRDVSLTTTGAARRPPRWAMPMIAVSVTATVVSGAVWLVLQAADLTDSPLDEAWRDGALGTLLFDTYAGRVWQIRIGMAAALVLNVGALAVTGLKPMQGWLNATGLALAGAVLISAAWLGHAGADPSELGPLHLSVHAAHMLAAATWLGGLLPFSLLLRQARRAPTATDLALARRTGIRFGNLAQLAVAILLLCGIVNTGLVVDSFGNLLTGEFAELLAAKVGLLLIMLVLAAENRRRLVPNLASDGPAVAARLHRNVIGELALGGLILLIAGVLGITAPNGG